MIHLRGQRLRAVQFQAGAFHFECPGTGELDMAESDHKTLAPAGIRVNGVAPGPIWTPSEDASYMTGQVLHPNGGDFIST
jgi:hypothetical protein